MAERSVTTQKTSLIAIVFLALLPALLYMNTLGNSFQYDDYPLIVGNAYIHDPSNIGHFFVSPQLISNIRLSGYRPLTMTTFALNYAIGGDNPAGYHAVNVAIHVVSVLLVFGVALTLMRTFEIPKRRKAAFAAALLFAAHPINTQPVNYIAGRSTLLVGCFSLACFFLYLHGRKEEGTSRPGLLLACSLAAYACALFSKEEAVAVPGLLAAYELCRLRLRIDKKSIWRIAARLLPFIALTLGFMILVVRVMKIVGETAPARGVGENLLTQAKVLFLYLKMIALPTNLSIDHVVPMLTSLLEPVSLVSVLGVVMLLGGSLLLVRRAPDVPFGIWWMAIALVPTSTLIALKLVLNEQRLYLAAVGVFVIAGARFGKTLHAASDTDRRLLRQATIFCFVSVVAIFSVLTIGRNAQWRNPMSLWNSTLQQYPDSMRANAQIANEYLKMNRPEDALPHAQKAVEAGPDVLEPRLVLATTYSRLGLHDEALMQARHAVDLDLASSEAQSTLGTVYARLERWDEAETAWKRALELDPYNRDASENLARLQSIRDNNKEMRE